MVVDSARCDLGGHRMLLAKRGRADWAVSRAPAACSHRIGLLYYMLTLHRKGCSHAHVVVHM